MGCCHECNQCSSKVFHTSLLFHLNKDHLWKIHFVCWSCDVPYGARTLHSETSFKHWSSPSEPICSACSTDFQNVPPCLWHMLRLEYAVTMFSLAPFPLHNALLLSERYWLLWRNLSPNKIGPCKNLLYYYYYKEVGFQFEVKTKNPPFSSACLFVFFLLILPTNHQ